METGSSSAGACGGGEGSSSSSSSGRNTGPAAGRKGKGGVEPARCQVQGCQVDLSGAKAYYGRHKVCAVHSKSPTVVVAGLEQRFCQQCSRFHQLSEFDQGKRSCRRRLAGHNERRRKFPALPAGVFRSALPHHDSVPPASGEQTPARYGSFLLDFSYPRVPSTMRDPAALLTAREVAGNPMASNRWRQHDHPYSVQELPPGESLAGVVESSCALSLLSTQPWDPIAIVPPPILSAYSSFAANPATDNEPVATAAAGGADGPSWNYENRRSQASGTIESFIPCPVVDHADNDRFSGELELALQQNISLYSDLSSSGSPTQHPHHGPRWSD